MAPSAGGSPTVSSAGPAHVRRWRCCDAHPLCDGARDHVDKPAVQPVIGQRADSIMDAIGQVGGDCDGNLLG